MTDALSTILDHEFADPALLRRALLHRSAAPTGDLGYERLEFLGDRVLGLVVTDMLGMNPNPPRFVQDFLASGGSIPQALKAYVDAVREGRFPTAEQSFE